MKETNMNGRKEQRVNPEDVSGLAGRHGCSQTGGETPPPPAAETAALPGRSRMGGETAAPQPEEFLSKRELADRLKRKVRTIERWQGRGIIPYVKCGHSVLFNWPEVVAHLEKNYRVCQKRSLGEPMRLPVYQMRDETKMKSKCRGGRALREGMGGQVIASSAAKSLPNGRGSEGRA